MSVIAEASGLTIADPDGRRILDRADIQLRAGEITGLVGESGEGKTTFAHALLGRVADGLRYVGGRVSIAGSDPFSSPGRSSLRGRITAYLPQDPTSALDPMRTIAAQLRTAARIAHPSSSHRERAALIRSAAETAALEPALLGRRPAALSGGQAQRALLCWTFVTRPRLLVLDEPTSGLDPAAAVRVSTAFAELPWQPAVLLISHDRELVDRVCDRVLSLEQGRLHSASAALAPSALSSGSGEEPADPVLSMSAATIRRGGRLLLGGGALHLGAGELVAVCGPSGSGKTSLARALCGLAPPRSGTLRLRGRDVPWDADARARRGGPYLAYVGQDARAALNPLERIRLTLQRAIDAANRRGSTVYADPDGALSLVGLPAAVLDRTSEELSGGQRHRVALARAAAAGPDVLVCDETTSSLDHGSAQRILDAVDALRHDTGVPVLLITHQESALARADRILTLAEGRLG